MPIHLVMFYDALRPHLTPQVINIYRDKNIYVCALPAHTSHRLQPLDVSLFQPLKKFTHDFLENHQQLYGTPGKLYQIITEFTDGVVKAFTLENITHGVLNSGLWPHFFACLVENGIKYSYFDDGVVRNSRCC